MVILIADDPSSNHVKFSGKNCLKRTKIKRTEAGIGHFQTTDVL